MLNAYITFLRFLHNRVLLNHARWFELLWVWGKKPLIEKSFQEKGFWQRLLRPLRRGVFLFNNFLYREICKHHASIAKGHLPVHLGGHFGKTILDEGALVFLKEQFAVASMIDVGCGPGGQVELARKLGIEAFGIDGDYTLKRKKSHYFLHDFTTGVFPCKRRFDLAWCVEFLEHVEEKYQPFYMDILQHANRVACTSAPPGWEGFHHVNCREQDYWISVFKKYGFVLDKKNTERMKERSSMQREFMRDTGMLFVKK